MPEEFSVEEIARAFDALDTDHDGKLNRSELAQMFRSVDFTPTKVELDYIFKQFDTDSSGTITKKEFINYIKNNGNSRNEVADPIEIFRAYDTDNDGAISLDEFLSIVVDKAQVCDRDFAEFLFMLADSDNDGRITLNEYKGIIEESN